MVQHALCAVIVPIFDRAMIFDTYACRAGKGTHAAVLRFNRHARRFKYVLKLDVRKFFPSIDHEILKAKIRRKIKCRDTLWLIDLIIDSSNPQDDACYHFPGDTLLTPLERRRGILIGNLSSQIFANLYLCDLDHQVTERMARFRYLRYMDDLALFHDDKASLWAARDEIERVLAQDRLRLRDNKSMVYPTRIGVDWLGYKVFLDHRRVRYENIVRYRRRLKAMQERYRRGQIDLADVNASVQSWIGHVKWADAWRLRESLLGSVAFQRGGA